MLIPKNITTLLFDLDGVVFDTETNYTNFWKRELLHFLPEEKDVFDKIKGSTLNVILNRYFPDPTMQKRVVAMVDRFEQEMTYDFIPGFEEQMTE
ncbi:MAG: HAD hydrolase-like protein, partial [Bacteroidales bacterium]